MADRERVGLPRDLDSLLRQTLVAEPSPEFLARVRGRIDEDRQSSRWLSAWLFAAGAAAVALAVVIAFAAVAGRQPVRPEVPSAPAFREAAGEDPRLDIVPIAPPKSVIVPRVAPVRRSALRDRELLEMPVVIVDQQQRAALNAMLRMMQEGRLTEETFAQVPAAPGMAIEESLQPLAVESVAVSPITIRGVLQKN